MKHKTLRGAALALAILSIVAAMPLARATQRADTAGTGGERSQTLQVPQTATQLGLNAVVPKSGSLVSPVLLSNGYLAFALGLTSTKGGAISIQRYLDAAGTIAVGAAITAVLVANTAQTAIVTNDGKPFQSMIITITNTDSGADATLSNVVGLWQSAT